MHVYTIHLFINIFLFKYSDVPIIKPPIVLVESGLNSEYVGLINVTYFALKTVFRY